MKVTRTWLENNFKKFNVEYFDGALPMPLLIINNSYRAFGLCGMKRVTRTHYIKISNFYDRTEKAFQQTLIHEMIHLYFNNKGMYREHHGSNFQRMARSFDKYGWNIHTTTQETNESNSNLIPTRYFVKFFDSRDNKIWFCCVSENKISNWTKYFILNQDKYSNINWYITRHEKFGHCRKSNSRLSGMTFTNEKKFDNEILPYVTPYHIINNN